MTTIAVTKPLLPPLEEFVPYLEEIWASGWLTNGGTMHQRLESALAAYLDVEHLVLVSNGTLALSLALRACGIDAGEVITTPYTFVATPHAIAWAGARPVFVDIEAGGFNIDADRVEAAITPQTVAIMPVHVYGRPCDVDRLEEIGRRHGIPVIFDAAHAFGVRLDGRSLLRRGDMAVLSFHATKIFSTVEGGAIVCRDAETKARLDRLKNFGIVDETTIPDVGLNAKLNEVQSAFGLALLSHVDRAMERRRAIDTLYRRLLADVAGISVPPLPNAASSNAAYFPILVEADHAMGRDGLQDYLREHGIQARRYFFPLCSDLPMYARPEEGASDAFPFAARIAERVLCLPLHTELDDVTVERIASLVQESSARS